jgi:serine/threonine protein kinase/WD40 repeat protein
MALTVGTQLGSHEITALLGKGGMGEVYRARDLKLKREVAIKILPDEFSRDPVRVSRFQREAEVLASLNHPNIAAIYDLQEVNDTRFLVLELVEGETLAERIQRGPIPVEEALDIAKLICEALEAAHEKGIVHRDLKPANVKVTPNAKVKVLDFGLAKALDKVPSTPNLSNSPTLSLAATNAGLILGTAAYMSPEQAKGTEADLRSDVFSFGCVFYEMLTGRQAFHGESVSEILAAVLIRDADLSALPPNLNPRVQELLRRCLEKNAKRRWQAVGDLRVELETISTAPRAVSLPTSGPAPQRPVWKRAIPIVASTIIFSILAAVTAWMLKPSTSATITKFAVTLPEDQNFGPGTSRQLITISSDGTKLVYLANNQLFLRQMNEVDAHSIPGTANNGGNITNPFFSPDGEWVGFFSVADAALKKIPISGGTAVTICKSTPPFGVSWDGKQIVFAEFGKGIMRVAADGGVPETLVTVKTDEGTAYGPQIIDGGRAVLFTLAASGSADRWDQAQIVVQSLTSNERKTVLTNASDGRYVSTGHIVYTLGANLMALPFDLAKLQPKGGPIPLIEGIMRALGGQTGVGQFSFANNGTLVYISGISDTSLSRSTLALVDRATGKAQALPVRPAPYSFPQMSPDGKRLAVTTEDGIVSIYDMSAGGTLQRLTFGSKNSNPIWSRPDGKYVFFTSDREGNSALFRQLADGTGMAEALTTGEKDIFPLAESAEPSGKVLAFTKRRGSGAAIWFLPLDGDRTATQLVKQPNGAQSHAAFSPNGRWLAYTSTELRANSPQIFVQPYPATGAKYQVTTDGGTYPLWSQPDGKQLFYVWNDQLYVVDVRTETPFSVSKPSTVPITGIIQPPRSQRNYDITPDGKQFVVVLLASAQGEPNLRLPRAQINIELNWFRELQERVPVK